MNGGADEGTAAMLRASRVGVEVRSGFAGTKEEPRGNHGRARRLRLLRKRLPRPSLWGCIREVKKERLKRTEPPELGHKNPNPNQVSLLWSDSCSQKLPSPGRGTQHGSREREEREERVNRRCAVFVRYVASARFQESNQELAVMPIESHGLQVRMLGVALIYDLSKKLLLSLRSRRDRK